MHEEKLSDSYHGFLSKELECYIQRCAQKPIDMVTTLMALKFVGSKNGTWHCVPLHVFLSILKVQAKHLNIASFRQDQH